MVQYSVGDRVFHRRADLYGEVMEVEEDHLVLRYEWPWDGKAPPQRVPRAEVEPELAAFEEGADDAGGGLGFGHFLALVLLALVGAALVAFCAPPG